MLGAIWGTWDVRGVLGLAQIVGTQGLEGYRWNKRHWGLLAGVGASGTSRGTTGCQGVSLVHLGAGNEYTYSGARRDIGGIRGHWWAPRGW